MTPIGTALVGVAIMGRRGESDPEFVNIGLMAALAIANLIFTHLFIRRLIAVAASGDQIDPSDKMTRRLQSLIEEVKQLRRGVRSIAG